MHIETWRGGGGQREWFPIADEQEIVGTSLGFEQKEGRTEKEAKHMERVKERGRDRDKEGG